MIRILRIACAAVCAALLAGPSAGPARGDPTPLTVLAAPGAGDTLVVFYSGDGGWAGAARGMSAGLVRAGLPVVGINSLSYFARPRTPDGAAADLAVVSRRYLARWGKRRIVLAGYSFGAGALPLIAPRLPPDLRARIRLVVLVDPEQAAELRFWPGDWLDLSAPGAPPIGPAMEGLKGLPLVCIYGARETGAACARLPPDLGRSVRVPGGHHYGGDYAAVDQAILAALPR